MNNRDLILLKQFQSKNTTRRQKENNGPNILINFINMSKSFENNLTSKVIIKDFNFKL